MNTTDIRRELDRIEDLPTLPAIATELDRLLKDPDSSMDDVIRLIEADPVIVSKLLKLVNSSFYGFRSRIGSVRNAVVLLGFNTVHHAVITVSILEALQGRSGGDDFPIEYFWIHSFSVAAVSRLLASEGHLEDPEAHFIGGLIHDIGKLICCQYFRSLYRRIIERMETDGVSYVEAERGLTPIGHDRMGALIVEKWRLPAALADAVMLHHEKPPVNGHPSMAAVIRLSDQIVHNRHASDACGRVSLDAGHLPQSVEELTRRVDDWYPTIESQIRETIEMYDLV